MHIWVEILSENDLRSERIKRMFNICCFSQKIRNSFGCHHAQKCLCGYMNVQTLLVINHCKALTGVIGCGKIQGVPDGKNHTMQNL